VSVYRIVGSAVALLLLVGGLVISHWCAHRIGAHAGLVDALANHHEHDTRTYLNAVTAYDDGEIALESYIADVRHALADDVVILRHCPDEAFEEPYDREKRDRVLRDAGSLAMVQPN